MNDLIERLRALLNNELAQRYPLMADLVREAADELAALRAPVGDEEVRKSIGWHYECCRVQRALSGTWEGTPVLAEYYAHSADKHQVTQRLLSRMFAQLAETRASIRVLRSQPTSEEVRQMAHDLRSTAAGVNPAVVAADMKLHDEAADLIESLARSEARQHEQLADCSRTMLALADERDQARAESAAHKADAERYRWLRDDGDGIVHVIKFGKCGDYESIGGDDLDNHIDAARSAK